METGASSGNRRSFFRVRLANHPATLRVLQVADRRADLPPFRGWMEDLSAGGCAVACDLDLPIRLGVVMEIEFQLFDEVFRLRAEPLRKIDDRRHFSYGLSFLDLKEGTRARLVRVLHRLEIEERRRRQAMQPTP